MITRQSWKNIEAEFGEFAFERVQYVERGDLGQRVHYSHNNNDVDNFLHCREYELRPLPELFVHDDSFYINAFELWQFEDLGQDFKTVLDFDSNQHVLDFFEENDPQFRVSRKDSAALPFDLERAKAGDVTEALTGDGEWRNVEIMGVTANKIFVKWFDNSGDFFNHKEAKKRLRIKYPARKPCAN
jgi:hypothetical protein